MKNNVLTKNKDSKYPSFLDDFKDDQISASEMFDAFGDNFRSIKTGTVFLHNEIYENQEFDMMLNLDYPEWTASESEKNIP